MSIIRCVLGAAIAVVPASSLEGATPRPDDRAAAVTPSPSRLPAADMAAARRSILKMIDQVRLPVDSFTLSNGLRVLVHTDRSTPIVRVGVWYDVGSKHEPAGKSGFAHLFEHLMFNGSENVPGDYLPKLVSVGAEVNGNTSVDRTHYYEVVPTQALDRALFMESDRMGHLLGALRQATLDEQRGVVQNEKREGSSDPLAIVQDLRRAALYPASHPYGHSLIGSMKDLDAADLDDVRRFFKAHYGPNNAVLMLAGDVDVATAKRLVGKYFGAIPAGPRNMRPDAAPVLLERAIRQTTTAPVSLVSIVRSWPVPGRDSPESLALDGVAVALAGGPTSPLQTDLVRERRLFRGISARNLPSAQAGEFTISGTVMPGVDPQVAAAALDAELATFFKRGPSPEFVTRWVANTSYQTVRSLESMVVRAARMGEDAVMRGDPQAVKADLRFYAGLTPAAIAATARKWLDRPRWELTVTPGPRVTPPGDEGIDGSPASRSEPKASGSTVVTGGVAGATGPVTASDGQPGSRGPLPAVGAPKDPRFPTIEHARLANGIRVAYARWGGTPFTRVGLIVDGGGLNEAPEDAGTLSTMYSLLSKSFAGMSEDEVRQRLSLSGIGLSSGSSWGTGSLSLDVSDANLETGLTFMRQALTQPEFPGGMIDRLKRQAGDRNAGDASGSDGRQPPDLDRLLDAGSPYLARARPQGDDPQQRITRDGVVAAYHRWLRPEHAVMTLVSDKPLAALLPMLNRTIGEWRATGEAKPVPPVSYTPQPGKPEIVLIDRPGAVQASIVGGQRVAATDRGPSEALSIANTVLAGNAISRLNMNLREDKHWTYGASGAFQLRPYSSTYTVSMDVQQDKVGAAIGEVVKEMRNVLTDRPITAAELADAKRTWLGLSARLYTTGGDLAGSLEDVLRKGRSDDYANSFGDRVRAVTPAAANAALAGQLDPAKWIWVITGNAALIRPQLDRLGLPVRVVTRDRGGRSPEAAAARNTTAGAPPR